MAPLLKDKSLSKPAIGCSEEDREAKSHDNADGFISLAKTGLITSATSEITIHVSAGAFLLTTPQMETVFSNMRSDDPLT